MEATRYWSSSTSAGRFPYWVNVQARPARRMNTTPRVDRSRTNMITATTPSTVAAMLSCLEVVSVPSHLL